MLATLFAMDYLTVLTFAGAVFVLCITPGSDVMFIIASGLSGGPRAAVMAVCGIVVGVMTHIMIAAAGLTVLITAHPEILTLIQYVGAAYLFWLAVDNWRSTGDLAQRNGRAQAWPAFRRGFTTNILNVKVSLFILALLPQFTDPAIGPVWHQILILGVIMCFIGFIIDGIIGLFAGAIAGRLRNQQRNLNRFSAIIFVGIGIRLILPS